MTSISRWLVAVAIVCLVVVWIAKWVNVRPRDLGASRQTQLTSYTDVTVGDAVCRPNGERWSTNDDDLALVSVGASTCGQCSVNRPFEEDLFDAAQRNHVSFFYVLGEDSANDTRAVDLAREGRHVIRARLREFGVMRTPTLLAVAGQGTVKTIWTGVVPAERRDSILKALISGDSKIQQYSAISGTDLLRVCQPNPDCQVLALSAKDAPPSLRGKTTLIPVGQLVVRSQYELRRDAAVYVDCRTASKPYTCQEAAILLTKLRFVDVSVVDLPVRQTCQAH
jgi:hypothetical protein